MIMGRKLVTVITAKDAKTIVDLIKKKDQKELSKKDINLEELGINHFLSQVRNGVLYWTGIYDPSKTPGLEVTNSSGTPYSTLSTIQQEFEEISEIYLGKEKDYPPKYFVIVDKCDFEVVEQILRRADCDIERINADVKKRWWTFWKN